ncbi:hypothetical protein P691DRAFT_809547 [Macrolepiota fuliginosa MF-IS2]|uniref:VHS domain-containing protein n=1 Tax=Macrolepiota fuliginosa MF-IS2 TaxID=1400762 RepID=A0A9P5X1F7_9AGAR|nr:hypothetical protein P691DRAFT_809547 [Macrolepiota fuliginosa MF-IS2]
MRRNKRKITDTTGDSSGNSLNMQGRKKKQKGDRGASSQDSDLSHTAGSSASAASNQTHTGSFSGAHDFTISSLTMVEGGITNEGQSVKLLSEHIIVGAEFDLSDHRPSCHPGTRLNISRNIQAWMHNPARKYNRNDPQCVFITIAYQLSMKYPAYRKYIIELLAFNPAMVKKSMLEQFKAFIIQPFAIKELLSRSHDTVLILLDGLDECEGNNAQREIIFLIAKFALQYPTSPLIWLIASRPKSHIQDTFSLDAVRLSYGRMEVDVDSDEGRHDVEKYLQDKFADIRKKHRQSIPSSLQQWPSESDFTAIATRSSGLFIFPSTLIRSIGDKDYADPISRLKIVLDVIKSTTLSPGGKNPFATLDALYTRILSEIPPDVLQTTLSLLEFDVKDCGWYFADNCNRLGVPQGRAYGALRRLHSVLEIPEPEDAFEDHLYAFHASFYDYLSSPSRSGTFYIWTPEIVQRLIHRSIDILLELHSVEMSDVDATRINLSWPDEEFRLDLRRSIFGWALDSLIGTLHKDVNDSIRNAFSRLSAFFQDLDFGERLRAYDGLYMLMYPVSVFSTDLENWGVLKTVPLRSFNYNDIRPDLDPVIELWRGERDDVSLRVVLLEYNGWLRPRVTHSSNIVDSRDESHSNGISHVDPPQDPNLKADLEKNLASWTSVAPSHPISCAVTQFQVPGEGLWLLALPCVQSS